MDIYVYGPITIHTDVCGSIMICVIDGYTCFIINDNIRYGHVYLMKV